MHESQSKSTFCPSSTPTSDISLTSTKSTIPEMKKKDLDLLQLIDNVRPSRRDWNGTAYTSSYAEMNRVYLGTLWAVRRFNSRHIICRCVWFLKSPLDARRLPSYPQANPPRKNYRQRDS